MNLINININNVRILEDKITQVQINNLRRQFQSSNINIIIGAGFSYGVVELLGNIENDLYLAESIEENQQKVIALKKHFFRQSILPLVDINKITIGESERIVFLSLVGKIIENRKSAILHKIVNLYTTNYDLLLEIALEKCHLEYVDGFSGKLRPVFSTANYGMIFNRQTSVSSMTSEVMTFNLYKLHGSLNWQLEGSDIINCNHIHRIEKINAVLDDDLCFVQEYEKLAIVNPTKMKLNKTVIDTNYYDQLRIFSNEMEKSNTILLSFGFSFNDEHIRQIAFRFLKGNPTLNLVIFSFNKEATDIYCNYFDTYSNVTVIQLVSEVEEEDGTISSINEDFTLARTNAILEEIYNGTK